MCSFYTIVFLRSEFWKLQFELSQLNTGLFISDYYHSEEKYLAIFGFDTRRTAFLWKLESQNQHHSWIWPWSNSSFSIYPEKKVEKSIFKSSFLFLMKRESFTFHKTFCFYHIADDLIIDNGVFFGLADVVYAAENNHHEHIHSNTIFIFLSSFFAPSKLIYVWIVFPHTEPNSRWSILFEFRFVDVKVAALKCHTYIGFHAVIHWK